MASGVWYRWDSWSLGDLIKAIIKVLFWFVVFPFVVFQVLVTGLLWVLVQYVYQEIVVCSSRYLFYLVLFELE
jgi:hypothetical protein